MEVTKNYKQNKFEQVATSERQWFVAETVLQLGSLAMQLSQVERVPRYPDSHRENDAEHSYMLGLIAPELARMLYPQELDSGLVAQFATVHEFDETITLDMATFNVSEDQLRAKKEAEELLTEQIAAKLPPHTRQLYLRYKAQVDPEAVFVCAVDKFMPVISDIQGEGVRVMQQDYGIYSLKQLKNCHQVLRDRLAARFGQFPELIFAYELLTNLFQAQFAIATPGQTPTYLD